MEKARQILEEKGYTCVLRREEALYTATERGVKPLVRWLTQGRSVLLAHIVKNGIKPILSGKTTDKTNKEITCPANPSTTQRT